MWAVKASGMPAPKRRWIQGPAQLIGLPRRSMGCDDPTKEIRETTEITRMWLDRL